MGGGALRMQEMLCGEARVCGPVFPRTGRARPDLSNERKRTFPLGIRRSYLCSGARVSAYGQ